MLAHGRQTQGGRSLQLSLDSLQYLFLQLRPWQVAHVWAVQKNLATWVPTHALDHNRLAVDDLYVDRLALYWRYNRTPVLLRC